MFWILIAVVILAPLPFGAVETWAWGPLGIIVGILLLGWCAERIVMREAPAVSVARVWPMLLFFGIAVGWALLQMSPFMPESWSHPLWKDAGEALGSEPGGFISVNPYKTGSALVRLLYLGGIFWLGLQYGRDRDRAAKILNGLAIAGLAYAAYGLAVEFSGSRSILWYAKTSYIDNVTSTFVNRNSYATYAGLGLVCVTALLVQFVSKTYGVGDVRREKLRRLLAGMTAHGWILLLAWVALATALLLTDSRGGLISTCAALVTLFVAVGISRMLRRRQAAALVGAVILAGIAILSLSGEVVTRRLADTNVERENRMRAYELTAEATADAAWLGTGYGTFKEIFRLYRDETIPGIYNRAHNTYLENALELGIPGASALFLAVFSAAAYCAAGVRRRRRDMIYPIVALAASVLVGVHSAVDFSLQIPAVGATFALILGVGCAQSWSSRRQRE